MRERTPLQLGLTWVTILGTFLALVIASSWPLARDLEHLTHEYADFGDFGCSVWHPWSLWNRIRSFQDPFYATELFHPHGLDTAPYVWNLLVPLLQIPFYLATHALRATALSMLAFGVANALAGYVLGRVVGGGRASGLAAGAVLACAPYAWVEMVEGRMEQGLLAFLVLALAGFVSVWRGGGRKEAVLTGLATAAAGLGYWFYGYFLALVATGLLAFALLPSRRPTGTWRHLLLAGAVAATLALPFALPVLWRLLDPTHPTRRVVAPLLEGGLSSARSLDTLTLQTALGVFHPIRQAPASVNASILAEALVLVSLVIPPLRRRLGWLPWVGLAGIVLAFGPFLQIRPRIPLEIGGHLVPLPGAILYLLPGFLRLLWFHRILVLAVGVAAAVAALLAALPGRPSLRWGVALALAALSLGESRALQGAVLKPTQEGTPFSVPPLLQDLAREPGAHPLLQMPMHRTGYEPWIPYHRQSVDGGLGDANPHLMPPWYQQRLDQNRVFAILDHLSDDPRIKGEVPDVEPSLCGLGYHYLLLWRAEARDRTLEASLTTLLGRPPDYTHPALLGWRLRPCGG